MVSRLVPDFHRAFMAIQKVEQLLKKVTRALDRAGIPYAVVGGNAVAAWVASVDEDAIRSTKDVDILVRRESLGAFTQAMHKIGMECVEVLGVVMFVDRKNPSPKRGVHLLFAKERVRERYKHPTPDVTVATRSKRGFLVVDLPSLLTMKLQSFRPIDQAHVIDLGSVGLITAKLRKRIPADLQSRLAQIEKMKD